MAKTSSALGVIIIMVVLFVALTYFGFQRSPAGSGESGKGISGFTGMAVVIEYADGTTEELKPERHELLPLTVTTPAGVSFVSLRSKFFCEITFTGTISYWEVTEGYFAATVYDTMANPQGMVTNEVFPSGISGSSWDNGEEKELYLIDTSAINLNDLLVAAGAESGEYDLKCTVNGFKITFVFSDGSSEIRESGTVTMAYRFKYSNAGIESMSLRVTTSPV